MQGLCKEERPQNAANSCGAVLSSHTIIYLWSTLMGSETCTGQLIPWRWLETLSATAQYAHLRLLGLQCILLLQQDHAFLCKEARLVGLPLPPYGNSWCQVVPLILEAAGHQRRCVATLTQLLSCAHAAPEPYTWRSRQIMVKCNCFGQQH